MAITLKIGISHLLAEFLTYTLVFLGLGQSARTVSALCFKPVFYAFYDLLVLV